jgi:hypothetical protein
MKEFLKKNPSRAETMVEFTSLDFSILIKNKTVATSEQNSPKPATQMQCAQLTVPYGSHSIQQLTGSSMKECRIIPFTKV